MYSGLGAGYGYLTGTVTDSSSAVVASAQVTVTNAATNFETSTVTNSEGLYRITFLRPGTYRVRITAPGFKTFSGKMSNYGSARRCRLTA